MALVEVCPVSHSSGTSGLHSGKAVLMAMAQAQEGKLCHQAPAKALFQVSSPNTSLAKASHRAEPQGKGAWRHTAPKVGGRGRKYLPNNNPNLAEGFTEEVLLDGDLGFFQVDGEGNCCQRDEPEEVGISRVVVGGLVIELEAWHVLSLKTILSGHLTPFSLFPNSKTSNYMSPHTSSRLSFQGVILESAVLIPTTGIYSSFTGHKSAQFYSPSPPPPIHTHTHTSGFRPRQPCGCDQHNPS